jgi:P27 family predicted phage terminase small subunit
MGKRGPQPTPTAELKARKSWRANQEKRKNEIVVPIATVAPVAPSWLSEKGRIQFDLIAQELHSSGLLATVDDHAVGQYCERLSQYIELRDNALSAHPVIVKDGVARKNPVILLRDEALRDCLRLLRELGMSPTARVGLTTEKKAATPATLMMETEGGYAT